MTTNSPEYIEWLKENSMLYNAEKAAKTLSGKKEQWSYGFAKPKPREAVKDMPVWFNSYPASTIPFKGQKFIPFCGDARLWEVLQKLGVTLLRTGNGHVQFFHCKSLLMPAVTRYTSSIGSWANASVFSRIYRLNDSSISSRATAPCIKRSPLRWFWWFRPP